MGDGCVVELNRMFSTPCGTAWGRIGPHGTVGYPLYGTVWDCMGMGPCATPAPAYQMRVCTCYE
jgi:hypothetical protein